MATAKKPIAKAQNGAKKKPLRPTFKNFSMARSYTNQANEVDSNTPATKQDSTMYKTGFINGVRGKKPSADRIKYGDEGEYEKMGRWEGQNALKKKKTGGSLKPVSSDKVGLKKLPTAVRNKMGYQKNGGMTKKAKSGTSLGMKSVKSGYDNNAGVTRADFVSIGKGKAKSGTALKKQAATAIAMKKAGKAPKATMKMGGKMKKKCDACK